MRIAFISSANESLGIEYLSAYLKKHGHRTRVFIDPQLFKDENINIDFIHKIFDYKKKIINDVVSFAPDLIAFSVVSDFYDWASTVSKLLKKRCHKPIIWGGIHPTSVPEEVLENDFVDMVCVGEGEAALLEVVESLKQGRWPVDVLNIWTKQNGKIIKNQLRPLQKDLDLIPYPDKEVFYKQSSHYKTGYFTIASRGCLYACSYCHHSYLKKMYAGTDYYRCRSVKNLIDELKINFNKNEQKIIRFSDDIFPFQKDWLKEFSKAYAQQIKAPFICYIHPNTTDEETANLLKQSGCCEVQIGVQTLYEQTQKDILNRNINRYKWEKLIAWFRNLNISITAENIIGLPGQSHEEIKDMVRFYAKNRVSRIHVFWLRYYPHTVMTEKFKNSACEQEDSKKTFTRGGDVFDRELNKLRSLFSLVYIIPKSWISFIIAKKLYRSFFFLPVFLLNIFSNLTGTSEADKITRKRSFFRYVIYIKGKLWKMD
ncbi:MAG: B12-binding domain-containing radical SAM protein [PVC group bacterium]|nr:B12-binding domain-containing radical SAM protein [PVC group bacterium]